MNPSDTEGDTRLAKANFGRIAEPKEDSFDEQLAAFKNEQDLQAY